MKEKQHNYFYKITNTINKKYYFGIRSTDKEIENDKYFGSGTALRKAVVKYGKENFIKEVIANYPTRKEASDHEARVVTLELIQLEECYNCKTGGDNEFTFNHTENAKSKIRLHHKGSTHNMSIEWREKNKKTAEKNKGRRHTVEAIEKITRAGTGRKMSNSCIENRKEYWKNNPDKLKEKADKMARTRIERGSYEHTDETKLKIKQTVKRSKCSILGIEYDSILEASKYLGLTNGCVRSRILSNTLKFCEWILI